MLVALHWRFFNSGWRVRVRLFELGVELGVRFGSIAVVRWWLTTTDGVHRLQSRSSLSVGLRSLLSLLLRKRDRGSFPNPSVTLFFVWSTCSFARSSAKVSGAGS